MISNWNNLYAKDYESTIANSSTQFKSLPTGAYVCEIKKAEQKVWGSGKQCVEMLVEIIEGEYKNYFTDDYKMQKDNGNKMWRGVYNLWIPEEGAEDWKINAFCATLKTIEVSNKGYKFNGDESTLAGKKVVVMFRKEAYVKDGVDKTITKAFRLATIDDYRNNLIGEIKDKLSATASKKETAVKPKSDPFGFTESTVIDDKDLPF